MYIKTQTTFGNAPATVFKSEIAKRYFYSLTSAADLIDKPARSVFEFLKTKSFKTSYGKEFTPIDFTDSDGTDYKLLPYDVVTKYIFHWANKGHKPALDLLTVLAGGTPAPDSGKVKQCKPEQKVQLRLQRKLGGSIEVVTPAGKIDLLTSTEIIEIKKVCNWKAAIGQVMVYSLYYPSHQRRIHLFGQYHQSYRLMVEKDCEKLGIIVTWENESDGLNTKSC